MAGTRLTVSVLVLVERAGHVCLCLSAAPAHSFPNPFIPKQFDLAAEIQFSQQVKPVYSLIPVSFRRVSASASKHEMENVYTYLLTANMYPRCGVLTSMQIFTWKKKKPPNYCFTHRGTKQLGRLFL